MASDFYDNYRGKDTVIFLFPQIKSGKSHSKITENTEK